MKPQYISFWFCRDSIEYRLSKYKPEWRPFLGWFKFETEALHVPHTSVPRAWRMPAGPDSVVELRFPDRPSEKRVANPKVTVALIPDRAPTSCRAPNGYTVRINRKFIGWVCAKTFSGLNLSRNETTYFDFEE